MKIGIAANGPRDGESVDGPRLGIVSPCYISGEKMRRPVRKEIDVVGTPGWLNHRVECRRGHLPLVLDMEVTRSVICLDIVHTGNVLSPNADFAGKTLFSYCRR